MTKKIDYGHCPKCESKLIHGECSVCEYTADTVLPEPQDNLFDPVTRPTHYNSGSIECIEAMRASMTKEQFIGYCKGNAFKYNWRMGMKNKSTEDIDKSLQYTQWLLNVLNDKPLSKQGTFYKNK